jgi:DNA-binding GntR family transcriptional regulator
MPELKRPETLTAALARHIGDAIVSGSYAPATALPESVLAREFRVSRGSVREALRLLADDGLIEIFPHRGAWVAPMTARHVREAFGIRALLESFAARLAVDGGRIAGALDSLEAEYQEVERAAREGSATEYVDADRSFHDAISRLSDDSALLEMIDTLRPRVRRFIHWGRASGPPAEWASHAEIMAALRAGDADGTVQAVRSHIVRAGELLVSRVEERDRGAGDGRPGSADGSVPPTSSPSSPR